MVGIFQNPKNNAPPSVFLPGDKKTRFRPRYKLNSRA